MRNKAGFTLIEIMVSLVLVGLIAAISGTSVITATRSYLFARENNAITQKAQLALGRLNRELVELSDIKAATPTCIIYESPYGQRAVARVDNTIQLFLNPGNTCPVGSGGDILVDGVQNFSVMYNPSSGVSLWSMGQDIRNLFAVSIQIVLARPDTGGAVPFFTTVSPRNNNNSGGASLPSASNPPPEYSGKQCFVTTAAYGDADHPVVEVLRQFRDRVLLPTTAGKALVRYYYEVGPSLAAAIEDKPIACLLVRLLVTPLAGFALLSLSCPVLIPLILLLSWGLARLTLKALQRRSFRCLPRPQGQHGAMLVTLIAAMVVFSALGAVMIGMFGTSALSQVSGNNSMRAYYLAESGFRYAASEYVNASNEDTREASMASMHGALKTLSSGDGTFQLSIFPYYYKKVDSPPPEYPRQLVTQVFGGLPNGTDYNSDSWVKVTQPGGAYAYEQIASVVTVSNLVKFNKQVGQTWSSYPANSVVTPVCIPDRDVNSRKLVPSGGSYDLAFKAGTGALAFPEKNGIVMVRFESEPTPRILTYRQRDIGNNRLKGISDPNGGSLPTGPMVDPGTAAPYPLGSLVELTKFMRVESTGTFGAVSRKVTYYAPIGYAKASPVTKTQMHDQLSDLGKWYTDGSLSRIGTQTIGLSGGGYAMNLSGYLETTTTPGGDCLKFRENQIGLDWQKAFLGKSENFNTEWLRAGKYLSYDVEMKVSNTLLKYSGEYEGFGLSFRLDEYGNTCGLSLVSFKSDDTGTCDVDGIPNDMVGTVSGYDGNTPVLMLWMKQFPSVTGFSPLTDVVDTPHDGTSAFMPPPITVSTKVFRSGSSFSWQSGTRVRLTNTGGTLPTCLTSLTCPTGVVTAGQDYYIRVISWLGLKYIYLFNTYSAAMCTGCSAGSYWQGLVILTSPGSGTTHTMIAQGPVFTKLAHQRLTNVNHYYSILSGVQLKDWSTFLVRLNEAPSVSFVNGGGSVPRRAITSGDTVYQTADNQVNGTVTAIFRVKRNPLYRGNASASAARDWAGGTAQGVLMLEAIQGNGLSDPVNHPFVAGSTIFVEGPPGKAVGVVPTGMDGEDFRARDNWIQIYVGDKTGTEPRNIDPYDNYRGPIYRNSALWPPDEVEDNAENNDNFTLIRVGDYLNTSLTCVVNGVSRTGTYCLSGFFTKNNDGSADVLRFSSPNGVLFYSPQGASVFPPQRPEVGLHAYGERSLITNTYYDDFAIQIGPGYGIIRQGFLMPIQQ